MKKSRIIIPALALIALSTVASVTGTVAWFTASRTATVTASNFAVTKTSANLTVALSNGAYTSTSGSTVTINNAAVEMTHASFDHVGKNFYVPNTTATNTSAVALSSNTLVDDLVQSTTSTKTVVSAVTWGMSFTVKFAATGRDMALFFKTSGENASKVWEKDSANEAAPTASGKAFRIALVGTAPAETVGDTTTKVWAPNQIAGSCKYVSATGASAMTTGTAYDGDLIASGTTVSIPEDETTALSDAQDMIGYLGSFKFKANTEQTISYTVVAWYEGTDPTITPEQNDLEIVQARLSFEAVTLA